MARALRAAHARRGGRQPRGLPRRRSAPACDRRGAAAAPRPSRGGGGPRRAGTGPGPDPAARRPPAAGRRDGGHARAAQHAGAPGRGALLPPRLQQARGRGGAGTRAQAHGEAHGRRLEQARDADERDRRGRLVRQPPVADEGLRVRRPGPGRRAVRARACAPRRVSGVPALRAGPARHLGRRPASLDPARGARPARPRRRVRDLGGDRRPGWSGGSGGWRRGHRWHGRRAGRGRRLGCRGRRERCDRRRRHRGMGGRLGRRGCPAGVDAGRRHAGDAACDGRGIRAAEPAGRHQGEGGVEGQGEAAPGDGRACTRRAAGRAARGRGAGDRARAATRARARAEPEPEDEEPAVDAEPEFGFER